MQASFLTAASPGIVAPNYIISWISELFMGASPSVTLPSKVSRSPSPSPSPQQNSDLVEIESTWGRIIDDRNPLPQFLFRLESGTINCSNALKWFVEEFFWGVKAEFQVRLHCVHCTISLLLLNLMFPTIPHRLSSLTCTELEVPRWFSR